MSDMLQQARDLLTSETWIKGSFFGVNKDGKETDSSNAKCFCGIGACMVAEYHSRGLDLLKNGLVTTLRNYEVKLGAAAKDLYRSRAISGNHGGYQPQGHFPYFNDNEYTTLKDVLRVFDHAIKMEKEKEYAS